MAWKSSRLIASSFALPAERAHPAPHSSSENPRYSSHQVTLGHLCVPGVRELGPIAEMGQGAGRECFSKEKAGREWLPEQGADANWVKTTDAISYSPRLCSLGKKQKCNSSHFIRFL